MASSNKHKSISYAKWGYFFIIPFFVVYAFFSLYPMFSTIRDSFYKKMTVGLIEYPEEFVGVNNYIDLFIFFDYIEVHPTCTVDEIIRRETFYTFLHKLRSVVLCVAGTKSICYHR